MHSCVSVAVYLAIHVADKRGEGWCADCYCTAKSVLMCDGMQIELLVVRPLCTTLVLLGCLKCTQLSVMTFAKL